MKVKSKIHSQMLVVVFASYSAIKLAIFLNFCPAKVFIFSCLFRTNLDYLFLEFFLRSRMKTRQKGVLGITVPCKSDISILKALIHSYSQESCCRLLDLLGVLEDSSQNMSSLNFTVKIGLVVVL